RLAAALSKAAGANYEANRLPFQTIEFTGDSKVVKFSVNGVTWQCDLTSYECSRPVGFTTIASETVGLPMPWIEVQRMPTKQPGEVLERRESPWDGEVAPDDIDEEPLQKKGGKLGGKGGGKQGAAASVPSPDGNWTAFVREFNLWLRDKDGKETQLT